MRATFVRAQRGPRGAERGRTGDRWHRGDLVATARGAARRAVQSEGRACSRGEQRSPACSRHRHQGARVTATLSVGCSRQHATGMSTGQ